MHTLTIPQHNDPVARFVLIVVAVALAWLIGTTGFQSGTAAPVAAAQEPIILVATPTPALPTLAPVGAAGAPTLAAQPAPVAEAANVQPAGAAQSTTESAVPQTEPEKTFYPDGSYTIAGSQIRYYTDSNGNVVEARLPGVDDWVEPAANESSTFSAAQVEQLAVDPEVYGSLPVAGNPSESNEAPNQARRPYTGR